MELVNHQGRTLEELALSKAQAREILMPWRDQLYTIVEAANIDDLYPFPMSKTSRANLRHDAMTEAARITLDERWSVCPDERTMMWVGPQCILRFRKIEADGSIGGYQTRRAERLKENRQRSMFLDAEADGGSIIHVGYQADPDCHEIVDYLFSVYSGQRVLWVASFDEILGGVEPIQQLALDQIERPVLRVRVKLKEEVKDGDGSA